MAAFSMRALSCIKMRKCINIQKNEKICKKVLHYYIKGGIITLVKRKSLFRDCSNEQFEHEKTSEKT